MRNGNSTDATRKLWNDFEWICWYKCMKNVLEKMWSVSSFKHAIFFEIHFENYVLDSGQTLCGIVKFFNWYFCVIYFHYFFCFIMAHIILFASAERQHDCRMKGSSCLGFTKNRLLSDLQDYFCLSVAACKIAWAGPTPRYTSMLLGH